MPYKDKEKQKKFQANWYKKHKRTIHQYNKTKNENFLRWFYSWKATQKCSMCGESRIPCLEFHHKNPKEKESEIRVLLHARMKTKLLKELQRCVCVCSNCHRMIHYKENLIKKEGFAFLIEEITNN